MTELLMDLGELSVMARLVLMCCVALLGLYAYECGKGERDED